MNENNLNNEAKEDLKKGFRDLFSIIDSVAKNEAEKDIINESFKMIYCTVKGSLTEQDTYTRDGLIDFLSDNPEKLDELSKIMNEYAELAINENNNNLIN